MEEQNINDKRNPDGTFKKGVSGNPAGKRPQKKMTKEEMVDEMWSVFEEMLPTLRKDLKKMREKDRWSLINQLRKTFLTDAKPDEAPKDDELTKDINIEIVFGQKPKEETKPEEPMND